MANDRIRTEHTYTDAHTCTPREARIPGPNSRYEFMLVNVKSSL